MSNKDLNKQTHKCCICGKNFVGWGNNPWGALDKDGNVVEWGENDVCCDECNSTYVLSGRMYLHAQAHKEDNKDGR